MVKASKRRPLVYQSERLVAKGFGILLSLRMISFLRTETVVLHPVSCFVAVLEDFVTAAALLIVFFSVSHGASFDTTSGRASRLWSEVGSIMDE